MIAAAAALSLLLIAAEPASSDSASLTIDAWVVVLQEEDERYRPLLTLRTRDEQRAGHRKLSASEELSLARECEWWESETQEMLKHMRELLGREDESQWVPPAASPFDALPRVELKPGEIGTAAAEGRLYAGDHMSEINVSYHWQANAGPPRLTCRTTIRSLNRRDAAGPAAAPLEFALDASAGTFAAPLPPAMLASEYELNNSAYLVLTLRTLEAPPAWFSDTAAAFHRFSTYHARWERIGDEGRVLATSTLAFSRSPLRLCIRTTGQSGEGGVFLYDAGLLHHAPQSDIDIRLSSPEPVAPAQVVDAVAYAPLDLAMLLGKAPWDVHGRPDVTLRSRGFVADGERPRVEWSTLSASPGPLRQCTMQVQPGLPRITHFTTRRFEGHEPTNAEPSAHVEDWRLVEAVVDAPLPADAFDFQRQRLIAAGR